MSDITTIEENCMDFTLSDLLTEGERKILILLMEARVIHLNEPVNRNIDLDLGSAFFGGITAAENAIKAGAINRLPDPDWSKPDAPAD
jgi:hypothetical protein